ncbi:hypothetical protein HHX47_DHR2001198, partial [Lentinula edodes]
MLHTWSLPNSNSAHMASNVLSEKGDTLISHDPFIVNAQMSGPSMQCSPSSHPSSTLPLNGICASDAHDNNDDNINHNAHEITLSMPLSSSSLLLSENSSSSDGNLYDKSEFALLTAAQKQTVFNVVIQ